MRASRTVLLLGFLTAVGALLRFATLDSQSFWLDELVTVSLLHQSFGEMLGTVPESEATPYLYYVLAWPWSRIFGFGEIGLRSLSALVGTAMIPVVYGAGASLVSRRIGLIAAALVCVNPFLVWYAQEARSYSLLAFLAAGTLLFLARALQGGRVALVGWAVLSSLAIATHYFAIFIVAAEALWLLALVRPRRSAVLATLVPGLTLAAHVPLLLDQRGTGEAATEARLLSRLAGIPKNLVVGYSFPWEIAGSLAAAALLVVGVALVLTRATGASRRAALVTGSIAAFALVAPVVAAALGTDYVLARNMIAAIVPAAIFVAIGFAATRLGLAAAAALCALSVGVVLAVAADAGYGRTDWRGAAERIGAPTDRVIVVTPYMSRTLWSPYLPGLQEPQGATTTASEIVVLGLATEGGFSAGAVRPPGGEPPAPPRGFRLVELDRTPTYALARYRARNPVAIPNDELARLRFTPLQPGILVQRSAGS